MAKHFEFADFVEEFYVEFDLYVKEPGHYTDAGEWIEAEETKIETGGIVLPLTSNDFKRDVNGTYTEKDKKIYTTEPLGINQRIVHNGQSYTIDSRVPYEDYADVFIYFAKGVST